MADDQILKVPLRIHGQRRNGSICSVSFYSELVIFISFQDLVSFVNVGDAAVNVCWKLSENLRVF